MGWPDPEAPVTGTTSPRFASRSTPRSLSTAAEPMTQAL